MIAKPFLNRALSIILTAIVLLAEPLQLMANCLRGCRIPGTTSHCCCQHPVQLPGGGWKCTDPCMMSATLAASSDSPSGGGPVPGPAGGGGVVTPSGPDGGGLLAPVDVSGFTGDFGGLRSNSSHFGGMAWRAAISGAESAPFRESISDPILADFGEYTFNSIDMSLQHDGTSFAAIRVYRHKTNNGAGGPISESTFIPTSTSLSRSRWTTSMLG